MPPPPPTGPPTTNCCRRARDRPSTWAAGPGRFVAALAARGIPALGVDISAAAVQMTIQRGGTALHRTCSRRCPGTGAGRGYCSRTATSASAAARVGVDDAADLAGLRLLDVTEVHGRFITRMERV